MVSPSRWNMPNGCFQRGMPHDRTARSRSCNPVCFICQYRLSPVPSLAVAVPYTPFLYYLPCFHAACLPSVAVKETIVFLQIALGTFRELFAPDALLICR